MIGARRVRDTVPGAVAAVTVVLYLCSLVVTDTMRAALVTLACVTLGGYALHRYELTALGLVETTDRGDGE